MLLVEGHDGIERHVAELAIGNRARAPLTMSFQPFWKRRFSRGLGDPLLRLHAFLAGSDGLGLSLAISRAASSAPILFVLNAIRFRGGLSAMRRGS